MSDPLPPAPAGQPTPAPPEQVDLIAAAARSVPGVAALSGGRFGEYTTYLPGRRLAGVVEDTDHVTVAITAHPGWPLLPLAEQIRAAVGTVYSRAVVVRHRRPRRRPLRRRPLRGRL